MPRDGVLISFAEKGGCVMCKIITHSDLLRVWRVFWLFSHRNGKFCAFSAPRTVFCSGAAAGRRKFFTCVKCCHTAFIYVPEKVFRKNIFVVLKKVVSLHPLSPKKRRLKKSECYLKRMRRKR